jgi:hypothetical protein
MSLVLFWGLACGHSFGSHVVSFEPNDNDQSPRNQSPPLDLFVAAVAFVVVRIHVRIPMQWILLGASMRIERAKKQKNMPNERPFASIGKRLDGYEPSSKT